MITKVFRERLLDKLQDRSGGCSHLKIMFILLELIKGTLGIKKEGGTHFPCPLVLSCL